MSADQKKSKKKKLAKENELISNFIDKKQTDEIGEPSCKKNKLDENNSNNDDSLKLFKKIKTCSSSSAKTTVVSKFFNNPSSSTQPVKKSKSKPKRNAKSSTDIRQALNKQDKLLYNAINESCSEEGLDPYEMQLALALSESLKKDDTKEESTAKEGRTFENPFSATGKIQPIPTVLERYGFKSKRVYSNYEIEMVLNKKTTKRSKYQKVPTLLTQTSNEKRDEIIRNRVDDVLNSILFADLKTHKYTKIYPQVYSPYLLELYENYQTVFERSSTENMILSDYFVSDLFEESNVKAGHLLKDWKTIIGRDSSPETVKRKSLNEENLDKKEIKVVENSPKLRSFNSSCSDIFDGVESFTLDELDDNQFCSEENLKKVDNHLDLLHEKLSQAAIQRVKTEELPNEISSDVTEEYIYSPKVEIDESSKREEEIFDLTQYESPTEGASQEANKSQKNKKESTIDDQVYDLTQLESSEEALILENQNDLENNKEEILAQKEKENGEEIYDLTQHDNPIFTKSSFDENEIINISDEEINYSINRFQNNLGGNNSSNSQSEDSRDVMEIDNIAEQSLIDVIPIDDDFKIENSVSELLSNFSELRKSTSFHRKNKSTMFMENECNDDSIADIMKKYGVIKSPVSAKKSFTKIRSEPNLENSIKSIDSEEDMEIISEHVAEDDADVTILNDISPQNNSQSPEMNASINKSLANILNSPAVPQNIVKQKPRKSLGIVLNKKYVIDIESHFKEPDYSSMTPHELKEQLFKYGIRPLPVKKAVELLTHIYNQMHPKIRIAIDEELDINDSLRNMDVVDIINNIGMKGEDDEFVFQLDCAGILDDEEYVLPKIKKSKTPTCPIPLHISFYNMIRSNDLLQKYILEFRPLDLDQIYKHFRKFDLTYQLNDIIGFLDKRCITFKTKEQSYSKKHERKKQKRTQKS